MIHHASIPADDPERVARVLAELWRAEYFPFVFPGSFVVISGDDRGTTIEVCPRGYEQVPAPGGVGLHENAAPSDYSEVHLNMATPLEFDQVLAIARREGWIARRCDRASFNLVEFWLENKFLIELMTEAEVRRYRHFYADPGNWKAVLQKQKMPLEQFGLTDSWLTQPKEEEAFDPQI